MILAKIYLQMKTSKFKTFLSRHVKHGEIKRISHKAGLHPNSVYCWCKGRNQPNVISLVWFLRALSLEKNLIYDQLWLEYLYTLEGTSDAQSRALMWTKNEVD